MKKSQLISLTLLLFVVTAINQGVTAAEILPELGTDAVLERPSGKPRGSIILMPGGDGDLSITPDGSITRMKTNSVIRTRKTYVQAGFATLALSSSGSPSRAVEVMRKIASPVIVVGTSRAATRIHRALAADAIVISSGMLDVFQSNVGSAAALPPMLIVHHRQDPCRVTLPALVPAFQQWAGSKARIVWLDGGRDDGDSPCDADGHHGFSGIEGKMTGAILGFARSVRAR